MRHGLSGNKFGRNQTLRAATIRDLCRAVIKCESIQTTRAKAVEARKAVDRLITLGKDNTLAAKRRAFALLIDHNLVSHLFDVVAPRFAARQGGYTRIIKFAVNRQGDNAQMVLLELTERAVIAPTESKVADAEIVETKTGAKADVKADAKVAAKAVAKKPAASKAVVAKPAKDKAEKPAKVAVEKPVAKKAVVKKAANKE
ncbi:MAG: 50S ribosomal protein L17 [Candidatus Omnitrophica bacterium]|nr:50S ribosomal protein L17 [Candidatus Omnitrophota bacterium]